MIFSLTMVNKSNGLEHLFNNFALYVCCYIIIHPAMPSFFLRTLKLKLYIKLEELSHCYTGVDNSAYVKDPFPMVGQG